MLFFLKKIIYYINHQILITIRAKLIVITSILLFFSINLLVYITLIIFEENITNMVFFLHSKTATVLSDMIHDDVLEHVTKINDFNFDANSSLPYSYSDFLSLSAIEKKNSTNEGKKNNLYNRDLLKKIGLTENQIVTYLNSNLVQQKVNSCKQDVFVNIENTYMYFKKPIWLVYTCSKTNVNLSLVLFSKISKKIYENELEDAPGSNTFIINKQGDLIFDSTNIKINKKVNLLKHPVVHKMYNSPSQNGVLRFKNEDTKKRFFAAFKRMDDLQLAFITNIPEEIALEGVNTVRIGSFFVMMAVLCFAILCIYFYSNTLSRPIVNLVEGTKKITEGQYLYIDEPKTIDEVTTLTKAFNLMAKGLKEREKLKGAFGKFINKEIAQQILEGGELQLGGKRNEATIFFSDIRSFTAISENMQPEQVVEFLNEYMTIMVAIIHKHNGVVDKYIGDAIMAVWGTPIKTGNDVENALEATLEMRLALIQLNIDRAKRNQFPIKIGCGLNTGTVISGQIGSPERLEYTVIGDAVNLASRVESLSKPFAVDIVITHNTYSQIKNKYNVVQMPNATVKGKTGVQKLYALLGKKGDPKAPKNLEELRALVGITTKPVEDFGKITEEHKYEIKQG